MQAVSNVSGMSLQRFTRRELITANAEQNAGEIARLMQEAHVGAVIVVEEGRPIGIVTDRDLVVRVIAEGWPTTRAVRDIMTKDVVVAHADDTLDHAIFLMRQHGVRRLPVIDEEDKLVGLLALDDLLVLLSGEVSSVAETVLDNRGP